MASSSYEHSRSRVGWAALRVLLTIESVLLAWALVVTVISAISEPAAPLQNLSIVVMAALSLLWTVVTLVGALKARVSWVRGSSLTIHVLLFAAGTGCLQIGIGPWWLGFGIVVLALLGFVAAILARPEAQPGM
ncbi:MAG: hypothetical protein ACK5LO_07880 [Leucobacter sp.]